MSTRKGNTLFSKIKSKVMTKKFMTILAIIGGIIAAIVIIVKKDNTAVENGNNQM